MEYRKSSHAVYGLQYHIVLVTKYRRKCINEEIGDRLKKEIIRLIEGHVHILAELSPKYAVANEIATLKTVTARVLRRDYEDYLKQFLWGDNFWSRSYFVATSGGVTLDVLKEYVETQNRKPGRPHGTKKKK